MEHQRKTKKTIIIGLGNPVLTDDSVGIKAAGAVRERLKSLPSRMLIDVIELYAGGIRLLEAMTGYEQAVIIDAMVTGQVAPGTIRSLSMEEVIPAKNVLSVHDLDLHAALELGRILNMALPAEIKIWGIEAGDVETFSEALTPQVDQAFPQAVDAIIAELLSTQVL
jgi:hydrogenase maturation protease